MADVDASLFVDLNDLDLELVAHLHDVLDLLNAISRELGDVAKGFCKVKNDNILRGMWVLNPAFKLVTWIPVVKKMSQKILIFEKA